MSISSSTARPIASASITTPDGNSMPACASSSDDLPLGGTALRNPAHLGGSQNVPHAEFHASTRYLNLPLIPARYWLTLARRGEEGNGARAARGPGVSGGCAA